jgi:hypothetical protein
MAYHGNDHWPKRPPNSKGALSKLGTLCVLDVPQCRSARAGVHRHPTTQASWALQLNLLGFSGPGQGYSDGTSVTLAQLSTPSACRRPRHSELTSLAALGRTCLGVRPCLGARSGPCLSAVPYQVTPAEGPAGAKGPEPWARLQQSATGTPSAAAKMAGSP